ncbi:hypothetical protein L2E82_12186 [Cichorium intybus]|uniref:Uncharacterized protein n=1 Tax=Cichorium intybus TaxID=13427 RepID=A0ACB9GF85_CICIN|nr:hypothetical protein L2E82_12186 [Cichorium intybus]
MNSLQFLYIYLQLLLMTVQSSSSMAPTSSLVAIQRSSWLSQVPYLFAGLAAMLGLIAFALIILACSFRNHSRYIDNRADGERDLELRIGDGESKIDNQKNDPADLEEKYLVIMAGLAKPTFLAIPTLSRQTASGTCNSQSNSTSLSMEKSSTSRVEMVDPGEAETTQ